MAAVVASKPQLPQTKLKKPSIPYVQTNLNGVKPSIPSSSPSSAAKRLPGQVHVPTSATSNPAPNSGPPRPNRRLQRINTRNNTAENVPLDKKAARKAFAEPHVAKEAHILNKFKNHPPSLIVHLHPTHFRFDQQDGSFSYHSEMRIFIEHLQRKTIPHDMVEEFRKSNVQYYDGWLIVRVVDHRSLAANAVNASGGTGDDKPFSIHNYNNFITPSPYAPYPTKDSEQAQSPRIKHERGTSVSSQATVGLVSDLRSDDVTEIGHRSSKPQPKVFHVGLRPTVLSTHMDLVIDAMMPDPKVLHRKQSQAQINARTPATPATPIPGLESTTGADKGPPPKKQKMKIDANELVNYEAAVINSTAPPLYLEPAESLDEVENILYMLTDPLHDEEPPSPKSRKRTVAELAADDAHAKEIERFMLIMDQRNQETTNATNAGGVDAQGGAALFQPTFEKFNALEQIKHDLNEKEQRDRERKMHEDEAKRAQQQAQDEERKRQLQAKMMQQQNAARLNAQKQHNLQQNQQLQAQLAAQQQAMQRQPAQVNGIPPNMQAQMMQQGGVSPVVGQGTPNAASSPMIPQGGQHGSPVRPGSSLQHGHPGVAMARGPSGGPSRNGTPHNAQGTPAVKNATPIVRQGTPSQAMTQGSPHGSMMSQTPQMAQAMMNGGQMVNGVQGMRQPQNAAQIAEMQRRQLALQQQAQMAAQMPNGTPQMNAAVMAQQHAQMARETALSRQAMQNQQMAQGTPHMQQMASPAVQQKAAYNERMAEQMKQQLAGLQQPPGQGSPAPTQMTPQQQMAQMQQNQMLRQAQAQQQAQAQLGNMGQHPQMQMSQAGQQQQLAGMSPQFQQFYRQARQQFLQRYIIEAASKYGGNQAAIPQQEVMMIQQRAHQYGMTMVKNKTNEMRQQQQIRNMHMMNQQQAMMNGQGGGMQGMNGMQNMQNMAAMQGMNMQQMSQLNPNMAAALQHQQAQMQQQIQLQAATQHLQQQQMGGQPNPGAGGGGVGNATAQYQAQLQQMMAAQQAQANQQGQGGQR